MRLLLLILVAVFFISSGARAGSESYRVIFYPERMVVDIPDNKNGAVSVFVENKMLGGLRAKLLNQRGQILGQMSLDKGEFSEISLAGDRNGSFVLVPLIPSLQEAALRPGLNDYEIPPKR